MGRLPGAEIDNPYRTTLRNGLKKVGLYRTINIAAADNGFEIVGGAVTNGLRTPRLIKNLEQMKTPQSMTDLSTKPLPPTDPLRWR